jgi:hypothetical protein
VIITLFPLVNWISNINSYKQTIKKEKTHRYIHWNLDILVWERYKHVMCKPLNKIPTLSIYIFSPTKVKHHLTCFNNIFSNNELISNRFAVLVTCTHQQLATFLIWLIFAAPYQTNRKWNLKLYTKKISFRSQTQMLKCTRGTLHTLSYAHK